MPPRWGLGHSAVVYYKHATPTEFAPRDQCWPENVLNSMVVHPSPLPVELPRFDRLLLCVPHRPSGSGHVRQLHFGIFARENHPICAGSERGGGGCIGVFGGGFAALLPGWNADVDAWENFAFALHAGHSALCFASDIIRREACGGQFLKI